MVKPQSIMEKAFEKLLKKMLSEKYPMYLDVHVVHYEGFNAIIHYPKESYEVFLLILDKGMEELGPRFDEVKRYILGLARYMDMRIHGIYNEVLDEEEWEEMKLGSKK